MFQDGGARPNLFKVDFSGTPIAPGALKLQFTCRAASLPASTLGNIDVPYMGRKIKVAGDRTYADWTITILNDEKFTVKSLLEAWSHDINHFELNTRSARLYNLSQYKRDASIMHLDKKGDIIATYKFVGMYPTEVGAIDVAMDTNDTIEEYTVTFSYDYWEPTTSLIDMVIPKLL